MALTDAELVAFVGATDLGASKQFYEQALGLTLLFDGSPAVCGFDAHGTTVRVTAVPAVVPAGYTVLGWAVADIVATVHNLHARGVEMLRFEGMNQDASGVWTAPGGDLVAWFSDPAGNTLSVTQTAT